MIYIPLTKGRVALVDDEDLDFVVSGWPWHVNTYGYAWNAHGSMHRQLMKAPVGLVVDHINRVPYDNRRRNLRVTTQAINMQNCSSHVDAVSSYKGVWFSRRQGKWVVQRMRHGVRYNLGSYVTEAEAAAVSEGFDGVSG